MRAWLGVVLWGALCGVLCGADDVVLHAPQNITWCETSCDSMCMGDACSQHFLEAWRFPNVPCALANLSAVVAGGEEEECVCNVGEREVAVEKGRVYDPCLEYGGCAWRDSLYSKCRVQKTEARATTVECFSSECGELDILSHASKNDELGLYCLSSFVREFGGLVGVATFRFRRSGGVALVGMVLELDILQRRPSTPRVVSLYVEFLSDSANFAGPLEVYRGVESGVVRVAFPSSMPPVSGVRVLVGGGWVDLADVVRRVEFSAVEAAAVGCVACARDEVCDGSGGVIEVCQGGRKASEGGWCACGDGMWGPENGSCVACEDGWVCDDDDDIPSKCWPEGGCGTGTVVLCGGYGVLDCVPVLPPNSIHGKTVLEFWVSSGEFSLLFAVAGDVMQPLRTALAGVWDVDETAVTTVVRFLTVDSGEDFPFAEGDATVSMQDLRKRVAGAGGDTGDRKGVVQLVVALDTSRRYAGASTLVRLSLFAVRRYFCKDAKVWSVQMFMYANESIVSAGPKHSSGVVLAGVFHNKPNILVVLVVVVMGLLLVYFAFSAIYVFWLDRVQRKKGYFSFFAAPQP
jgi:hypothetical protein